MHPYPQLTLGAITHSLRWGILTVASLGAITHSLRWGILTVASLGVNYFGVTSLVTLNPEILDVTVTWSGIGETGFNFKIYFFLIGT